MIYSDIDEIIKILEKGSGVIYLGSNKDISSRNVVNILVKASESTDIDKIYYLNVDNLESNDKDKLFKVVNIDDFYVDKDINIPVVLFVKDGEISSYKMGKLIDYDEIEIYSDYVSGIHEVLGDICGEVKEDC